MYTACHHATHMLVISLLLFSKDFDIEAVVGTIDVVSSLQPVQRALACCVKSMTKWNRSAALPPSTVSLRLSGCGTALSMIPAASNASRS